MPPRQVCEKKLRELGLCSQRRDGSWGPASAYGEPTEKRAMLLTVMCAERLRGNKMKKQTFRLYIKSTFTVRTLQQQMKEGFIVPILGDFQTV